MTHDLITVWSVPLGRLLLAAVPILLLLLGMATHELRACTRQIKFLAAKSRGDWDEVDRLMGLPPRSATQDWNDGRSA